MDNFSIMDQKFEINCQSSYISYIDIHLEKNVDLKTVFLRFFFWRFIEVKWTIIVFPFGHYNVSPSIFSFWLLHWYSFFHFEVHSQVVSEKIF